MREYIEREALPQKKERGFFLDDDFNAGWNACLDKISALPAADVRPVVRGKWIWKKSGEVVCSKCNDLMAIVGNTEDLIAVKSYHNFCPNCGADMKEEYI